MTFYAYTADDDSLHWLMALLLEIHQGNGLRYVQPHEVHSKKLHVPVVLGTEYIVEYQIRLNMKIVLYLCDSQSQDNFVLCVLQRKIILAYHREYYYHYY